MSLPRHYVEIPTAAVTPEILALCVSIADLGDGRSLAKVRRAEVALDLDEDGDLVRGLPWAIERVALSQPYGSAVARVVLDEARLASAKPEELAAHAEQAKLDPKTATARDVLLAWHGVATSDDCEIGEQVAPSKAAEWLASPHCVWADHVKIQAVADARVAEGAELKP